MEAIAEWGALIHVEISQERFQNLHLVRDEAVFVIPKDVRVFQKSVATRQ